MTEQDGGWDDLDDVPAPAPPSIVGAIDWDLVSASLNGVASEAGYSAEVASRALERLAGSVASEPEQDSQGQPETGATLAQEESDALTLFGSPDQFHVAWQHWNGMPEFHMDNLAPDSTLVVKFRTPEDREAFAKLIGRTLRKEESRGIWYPQIVIAHFWDKRYRDAAAETSDNAPILSESDEGEDEADALDEGTMKVVASIEGDTQ